MNRTRHLINLTGKTFSNIITARPGIAAKGAAEGRGWLKYRMGGDAVAVYREIESDIIFKTTGVPEISAGMSNSTAIERIEC